MADAGSSQWANLLQNLGAWKGSFTRLSPQGQVLEDIPTLITFEGLNHNQTVRQTLQYFSPETGELSQEKVLEYSSLSRSVLFFEGGAFSQGSMQFGPFSEFGAELGFIQGDRRLRLVQLFNPESHLSTITLIREYRIDTNAPERPPLTPEALIGEWQGDAVTLYPDWRSPDYYTSRLSIRLEGDRLLQHLTAGELNLSSSAQIDGSRLLFDQGSYPIQVLLLTDGASTNTPLTIPRGKPFLLEAGWLIDDNLRQRMIRRYDARGGWISLTLVTERRIQQ
ncbi:MAG TPA: DUF3598 family protein [Crinalium sp.]|jgi:hypothetical protein